MKRQIDILTIPQVEEPLDLMLAIAATQPEYAAHLTPSTIDACMRAPLDAGKVRFFRAHTDDPEEPLYGFLTFARPWRPIGLDELPTRDDWTGRGPVLWLGEVVAELGISGYEAGRVAQRIASTLALPGERVVYWRRARRMGWFTVPGHPNDGAV